MNTSDVTAPVGLTSLFSLPWFAACCTQPEVAHTSSQEKHDRTSPSKDLNTNSISTQSNRQSPLKKWDYVERSLLARNKASHPKKKSVTSRVESPVHPTVLPVKKSPPMRNTNKALHSKKHSSSDKASTKRNEPLLEEERPRSIKDIWTDARLVRKGGNARPAMTIEDTLLSQEITRVTTKIERMRTNSKRCYDLDGWGTPWPSVGIHCNGVDFCHHPTKTKNHNKDPDPAAHGRTSSSLPWGTRGVLRLLVSPEEHQGPLPFLKEWPWVTAVSINPGDFIFTVNNRPVLIIERKREDDLSSGVGEIFNDQKRRLAVVDIPCYRVMYLLERFPVHLRRDPKFVKPRHTLRAIGLHSMLSDGFQWTTSDSLLDTVFLLQRIVLTFLEHGNAEWWGDNQPASSSRAKVYPARVNSTEMKTTSPMSSCLPLFQKTQTPAATASPLISSVVEKDVAGDGNDKDSLEIEGFRASNATRASLYAHPLEVSVRTSEKKRKRTSSVTRDSCSLESNLADGAATTVVRDKRQTCQVRENNSGPRASEHEETHPLRPSEPLLPFVPKPPASMRTQKGTLKTACFLPYALMRIPGLGEKAAWGVVAKHTTFWQLVSAYRVAPPEERDLLLQEIPVGAGENVQKLGPVLSTRLHCMLYADTMDVAWGKQRGSFETDGERGGTPGFSVTHRNVLTQILRCVHGVGLASALAINSKFHTVKDIVLFFHQQETATVPGAGLEDIMFCATAPSVSAKNNRVFRRVGRVLADRIEALFCNPLCEDE